MTLRNFFRSRFRTLAGIFAAAMGAGVLVNSFMMYKSPYFFLDFQFEKILRSDVDLYLKDERGIEVLREVKKLPGIGLCRAGSLCRLHFFQRFARKKRGGHRANSLSLFNGSTQYRRRTPAHPAPRFDDEPPISRTSLRQAGR